MNSTDEIAITAYVLICIMFVWFLFRHLRNYTNSNSQSIDSDIHNPIV